MARPRKVTTEDAPAPRKASPPSIAVLERRLQNPFGEGSPPINLKEPGWTVHVVNTTIRPGRYHDVVRNKGWIPVEPGDIDGDPGDFGFDVREGRIVRGERGQEVLMKMPETDYQQIQMAKDAANKRLTNARNVKRDVAQSAAKQYGDEAADFVHDNITVKTSRAPVPMEDVEAG